MHAQLDQLHGPSPTGADVGFQARTLRNLLDARASLESPDAVAEAVAANHDPVLYAAVRDPLPPVLASRDGVAWRWRCDLVSYTGVPLPGGEVSRSIGHWNSGDQVELFQVLDGSVTMVIAEAGADGVLDVRLATLRPRDWCSIPPAAWHVTYATEPSVVFNFYGEPVEDASAPKYTRGGPVPVRLVLDGPGRIAIRNEVSDRVGEAPVNDLLPAGTSLQAYFASAGADALSALADSVLEGR